VHKHFHANKLRKFHARVDSVTCDSFDLETRSVNTCAITYESDTDFGQLSTIHSTLSQPKSILLPSQKIDPDPKTANRIVGSTRPLSWVFFLTYLVMFMLLNTQSHSRIISNRNDYLLTEYLNV